jgi:uncharacterized membrane protein YedE/YeeE
MNSRIAAFISGLIFALGLGISGMTQPAKVTAFLDITGNWDPSLAFVMGGAILVHAVLSRLIQRRTTPLFASTFAVPTRTDIDMRLVGGAVLFGIGWGLGGFCPGPAVTSLASGNTAVVIFVIAMLAGMYLFKLVEQQRQHPASPIRKAAATA